MSDDLVQRLRAGANDLCCPECCYGETMTLAADRIEALEKRLLGAQLVHESDQRSYLQQSNRIHALELDNARLTIDGNQLRELCQLRYDRIEALEAALREISARVIRFTYQGPSLMELEGIARRALEGKS